MEIGVDEYFCISIYVVSGKLCSGNLLNNVDLITVKGDYTKIPHAENQAEMNRTKSGPSLDPVADKRYLHFLP